MKFNRGLKTKKTLPKFTKSDLYKLFGSVAKGLFHKGKLVSGEELKPESEDKEQPPKDNNSTLL